MTTELRCNLGSCNRLLAVVEEGQISLKCPRCGTVRRVPIVDLMAKLSAYLADLQTATATAGTNGKTNGKTIDEAGARDFFL